ncbi:MAG: extensin family protein [Pseudomonadota bacterium]
MRWRLIGLSLISFSLLFALHMVIPPQHSPFRPPDLNEPLGLATYAKLRHLKRNPLQCRDVLAAANVDFSIMPADEPAASCPLGETLVLERSMTRYNRAPMRFSCHQLAALYLWERRIVRPQAEKVFGTTLAEIQTYGTFSCRNIAGTEKRSEHAYANAIDIYGFIMQDGERVDIRQHWREKSPRGKFLARVHKGACRLFSVTLGPDFNADHADHFHLDMGSQTSCK